MTYKIHNSAFSTINQIRVKHAILVYTPERDTFNHSYERI